MSPWKSSLFVHTLILHPLRADCKREYFLILWTIQYHLNTKTRTKEERKVTDPPATLSQMQTFQNNVSKEKSSNAQKQQTHNQGNLPQEYIGLKTKYIIASDN